MMAGPRFLARRPRALLLPLALLLLLALLARAAPMPERAVAAAAKTRQRAALVRDENNGPDNGDDNGVDNGNDNGRDDNNGGDNGRDDNNGDDNGRDDNNDNDDDDDRDDDDDDDDDDDGRGNGADFNDNGVGSSDLGASDDGGACYPAAATVRLSDGRTVSMHDLQLGDEVQVDAAGTRFEPVTLFTHRSPATTHSFVRLSYQHPTLPTIHTLTLSPAHYASVLPPGAASPLLRAAEKVVPGDRLRLAGDGALAVVTAVERVVERGLFNPQTPSGEIVVDGVVSTCWTQEVDPRLAKLGMRLWNTWWALGGGRSFRGLDAGWRASWMLPKGKFEL